MATSHPVGDVLAVVALGLSYIAYLPIILSTLASFGAILYYAIRIYEYFKSGDTPEIKND